MGTALVVIVGGVAGGMSGAARLAALTKREHHRARTVGSCFISNCGLPYFVGGLIEAEEDLTLQTPEQLFDRFRLDVRVDSEVVAIDRDAHAVTVRSTTTGDAATVEYDRLVLSMGAAPVRPPIPGYERVRTLRTVEDAARLASDVDVAPPRSLSGPGSSGSSGGEPRRPRHRRHDRRGGAAGGPAAVRPELAILVADELAHGVRVKAATSTIGERSVTLTDGRCPPTWCSASASGLTPCGARASSSVERHRGRRRQPNERPRHLRRRRRHGEARTRVSRATSLIVGQRANRQGRRCRPHRRTTAHAVPSLGTAIVKVFDVVAATVGWNERRLHAATAVSGDPLAPVRPRHGLPGRRAWRRSCSDRARRSSGPRSSGATVSTSGST
jgi:hypothetical protein